MLERPLLGVKAENSLIRPVLPSGLERIPRPVNRGFRSAREVIAQRGGDRFVFRAASPSVKLGKKKTEARWKRASVMFSSKWKREH